MATALAAVATATLVYFTSHHVMVTPALPTLAVQGSPAHDCPQCARLAEQIDDLQRKLTALKPQSGSQEVRHAARPGVDGGAASPSESHSDPNDIEMMRAADAERRRAYMEGIAQSFNNEKVDSTWASYASTRVDAALGTDQALRGIAHTVDCRQQTCRVEIDDASGSLSRRLPFVALGLADVLTTAEVERVDQGGGRSTMVLYMSNRPSAAQPK